MFFVNTRKYDVFAMYNKQIKIHIKYSKTFAYTEFNYCLSFVIIQTKFVSILFEEMLVLRNK